MTDADILWDTAYTLGKQLERMGIKEALTRILDTGYSREVGNSMQLDVPHLCLIGISPYDKVYYYDTEFTDENHMFSCAISG